uniref:Alanine--tRNA ligase n=1 Tax=Guillardia theta TaxID=55529 RepID=A0A7S4KZX6_GUITH
MASLKRAVNTQKCIRAGGKHNDLDDVGKDTYHHTFFEMLGTWSFGDYFKKEAIAWAWEILTEVYKIPADRLYATYCEGNLESGGTIPPDEETRQLWLQYLPADHVLKGSMKDNFWEMGDTGPCGPCTELHFDRIGGRNAAHLVNQDDPDVLEVWNLVFMQFNREESGKLKELPSQHVDTGMGFERLVSVLQNKRSNYDTDVFMPIFAAIQARLNIPPYTGKIGAEDEGLKDTAYRVIADHARTLSFAIADGAIPSNEGRGYVLRRILRRAVRYGQQMLDAPPGFFADIIPTVVERFKDIFPELAEKEKMIIEVITEEENSFQKMLASGIKYFNEIADDMKKSGKQTVSGSSAFFLYDTMGFPIDLTEIMAEEKGFTVDVKGFEEEMMAQKQRSKEAATMKKGGGGQALVLGVDETASLNAQGVAVTEDKEKYTWNQQLDSKILSLFTSDGFVTSAEGKMSVGVIMDKTSFYAEAGGQVADTGVLRLADGKEVVVEDVQVYAGYILHRVQLEEGQKLSVQDKITCSVDYERRSKIAPNHSFTHILNFALRKVLGGDVDQKGSLCDDNKLRFDFTAKGALTPQQLAEVETICRQKVDEGLEVSAQVVPLEKAMKIKALRAVFGEQYPDPVRVLAVGGDIEAMIKQPEDDKWFTGSVELCGGTHLSNTRQAESFALVQEEAVAKGIRRITAVTKDLAKQAIEKGHDLESRVRAAGNGESLDQLGVTLNNLRQELDAAVISAPLKSQLRGELEVKSKAYLAEKKKLAASMINKQIEKATADLKMVGDAKFAILKVEGGGDAKQLKSIMQALSKSSPGQALLLIAEEDGKAFLLAQVPAELANVLKANEWLSEALAVGGGRGGGKADSAQGQVDSNKLEEVKKKAEEVASSQLK